MKATLRIPRDQFAYVEVTGDYESAEDALDEYNRLTDLANSEVGMSASDFKKVKAHMLETGEFDPNDSHLLSKAQKYWVNETKKAFRDIKEVIINQ